MWRAKHFLKNRQYFNFIERAAVYTGTVAGALAPIAATRYLAFPSSFEGEYPIIGHLLSWTAAITSNLGVSLIAKGIPLLYTTLAGTTIGILAADQLKKLRSNKRGDLEQAADEVEATPQAS